MSQGTEQIMTSEQSLSQGILKSFYFDVFDRGSCSSGWPLAPYITEADPQLLILLLPLHECWGLNPWLWACKASTLPTKLYSVNSGSQLSCPGTILPKNPRQVEPPKLGAPRPKATPAGNTAAPRSVISSATQMWPLGVGV